MRATRTLSPIDNPLEKYNLGNVETEGLEFTVEALIEKIIQK